MTPAMQTLLVGGIVLSAVAYVAWRAWSTLARARRAKAAVGCGDGCCK